MRVRILDDYVDPALLGVLSVEIVGQLPATMTMPPPYLTPAARIFALSLSALKRMRITACGVTELARRDLSLVSRTCPGGCLHGTLLPGKMTAIASILSDFWNDQLVAHDRQALFLVLVSFLGSFAFIRLSARLGRSPRVPWWPGSVVTDGGVHLHHLVWGICLMLLGGALGFALYDSSPWLEVCACVFGIGAGLTIDEFALWVYLDDVYWAKEGRSSIDAAVIAAGGMLLVLLGGQPFEVVAGSAAQVIAGVTAGAILLGLSAVCFVKQRMLHGAVGLFFFPVAAYGAARIAKPGSPWARHFYGERNPGKQANAEKRFRPDRRTEQLKERFRDAVGGKTSEVFKAKLDEEAAREKAASEIRHRAEQAALGQADGRRGP